MFFVESVFGEEAFKRARQKSRLKSFFGKKNTLEVGDFGNGIIHRGRRGIGQNQM